MPGDYKRVNLLIRTDQAQELTRRKLSLSALVRELIDERLAGNQIKLSVSHDVRSLYDTVLRVFGATDDELEQHLLKALLGFLSQKQTELERLQIEVEGKIAK